MPNADQLIKLGGLLVQLRGDAAYKPISKWRHSAENNSRPVLSDSVRLRQGRQDDVSLLHCHLTSASVYWVQTQSRQGRVLPTRNTPRRVFGLLDRTSSKFPKPLAENGEL